MIRALMDPWTTKSIVETAEIVRHPGGFLAISDSVDLPPEFGSLSLQR